MHEISLLYNISQALNDQPDLKKALHRVLELMGEAYGTVWGAVSILNPLRNEINIEVVHGPLKSPSKGVTYKLGEGITGKVIETGAPVAIPKISEEPRFLNRSRLRSAFAGQELSFVCVPIQKGKQVIGAFGAQRPYSPDRELSQDIRFMSVISTMIARHAIHLDAMRIEKERLRDENRRLQGELKNRYRITEMIGNSNKMREVFQMITQVSGSNATVLIRGESGTGKELVANAIHYNSRRTKRPFIKVNCAAIPENLIESELFGHERGAFTGAVRQKPGKFELAHLGTLFLDEIGSIGLDVQAKLLRALQEREFERVGGTRILKADVRFVAATNKNLEAAVDNGTFRGDLYYRLNVFPIYMPPLRERKTDILLLSDYFLEKYSKENQKDIKRFSTPAIDMLMDYHWPGNVRELENCIERAVLLCDEGAVHPHHLPPTLQTGRESNSLPEVSLETALDNLEKEMILDALKNARGNITTAAGILKTTVRKIGYKMRKYEIDYKDYRVTSGGF
jgi:Nif-specific regulatory protein